MYAGVDLHIFRGRGNLPYNLLARGRAVWSHGFSAPPGASGPELPGALIKDGPSAY